MLEQIDINTTASTASLNQKEALKTLLESKATKT